MRMCDAHRHPTIILLNASTMKQTYATPAHVGTNVRSVTQSRFGAGAVNSSFTRSGLEDDGETPWDGCRREVREETGLEVTAGRLVAVDTRPSKADGRTGLRFLFRAVHPLTAADVAAIGLQEDEASEHRFVTRQEARKLLRPAIARRVDAAWDAAHCVYLEDGRPAAGVDQPAG